MMTTATDLRIDDAAEILELHDIALFVIDSRVDAAKEWGELHAAYGDRIAVARRCGDNLIISWHYDHKPVAWRIRQAFRAVGLRATWGGEFWQAVHVDLVPRRRP